MDVLAADLKPRDILTDAAVGNALAADASLGCSTNTVLHLAAIATEAGLDFDLRRINEVAAKVPHICKIAPGRRRTTWKTCTTPAASRRS